MHSLTWDDLCLTWSPLQSCKEAVFQQVHHNYPWSSLSVHPWPCDWANSGVLEIIYVNPALVPWTLLCAVSSCVHEFWVQAISCSVNTLTLHVLRGKGREEGSREEDECREGGKDWKAILRLSTGLSAWWQRTFGSSVICSCSSSLQSSALNPQSRQLTHQPHHVFHPNDPAVAAGGSQTYKV